MSPAGLSSVQLGTLADPPKQKDRFNTVKSSHPKKHSEKNLQDRDVMEPPLQRRKKPIPPVKTSITNFDGNAAYNDDYVLLGNQSKFAPNIKYRSKSRDRIRTSQERHHVERYIGEGARNGDIPTSERSAPPAPRNKLYPSDFPRAHTDINRGRSRSVPRSRPRRHEHPPAPRVQVDTGAPKHPEKQIKHKENPSRNNERSPNKHKERDHPYKYQSREEKRAHNAANQVSDNKRRSPVRGDKSVPQPVQSTGEPKQRRVAETAAGDNKAKQHVDARDKRQGKLNEYVQTDLDRKVADSGHEAPSDYAMKYKAGIPPPRPKTVNRQSEYQKAYNWKQGVDSSPLLTAEQMVYNNNPQLYKPSGVTKSSEYRREFKPWPVMRSTPEKPTPDKSTPAKHEKRSRKKLQRKRSKSLEDWSPDRMPPAGKEKDTSDSDKRLLAETLNPQKLHFPHGKHRRSRSEYQNNYRAPYEYDYIEGAWRGAAPPHLAAKKDTGADNESPPLSAASSWYAEVMELRERADEYRRRAQGTHFSRQHLAQLYAQQTELWDSVSQSSALEALDLHTSPKKRPEEVKHSGREKVKSSGKSGKLGKFSRRKAWEEMRGEGTQTAQDEELTYRNSVVTPTPRSSVTSTAGTTSVRKEQAGRIPTPKLKPTGQIPRHHLDRTTPATGGALLTSPTRSPLSTDRSDHVEVNRKPDRSPQLRRQLHLDVGRNGESTERTGSDVTTSRASVHTPKASNFERSGLLTAIHHPHQDPSPIFSLKHSGRERLKSQTTQSRPNEIVRDITEIPCTCGAERRVKSKKPLTADSASQTEPYPSQHKCRHCLDTVTNHLKPSSVLHNTEGKTSERPGQADPKPDSRKEVQTNGLLRHKANSSYLNVSATHPTFGMPSRDTHVLMNEDLGSDRPLETRFVHSPQHDRSGARRAALRDKMNVDLPSTKEGTDSHRKSSMWDVGLGDIPRKDMEDDRLSLSVMSNASSCSLASEVLERARQRRNEFWGKPDADWR